MCPGHQVKKIITTQLKHYKIKIRPTGLRQRGHAPAWLMRTPVPSPGNKSNGGQYEKITFVCNHACFGRMW